MVLRAHRNVVAATVQVAATVLALTLVSTVPEVSAGIIPRALASKCPDVPVATNFQLKPYLGVWYEIADSKQFKDWFEKDLYCTTANYTLDGSMLQVDNSGRYGSPTGPLKAAIGEAKQVSGAKLEVKFGGPVFAPYWIVDLLGDSDSGFAVSVVWSCSSILGLFTLENLWVLSRTPTLPAGVTLDMLYKRVEALGIDVAAQDMLPTVQGGDCVY